MNNDLISRSELKKELRERLVACNDWEEKAKDNETRIRANAVKTFICEMFMLLKEFPTVEQKGFEQVLQPNEPKTVQDCFIAYGDGSESARRLFERPHGEWIKSKEWMTGTITTIYKCSECGRTIATMPNRLDEYPFCHCGADMRKGEEE